MKVIFRENTNEFLTNGKEYLVFEVYINFERQTTTFRLINDKGIPSIFNSNEFNYEFLKLDDMVYLKRSTSSIITLEKLYLKLNELESINDIWERYFNNDESIVRDVNQIIVEYAKEQNIYISSPNPYGF